jgi:single-strand DNA-binding protein
MLKCALIGNLGNEPEMRYSANGAPFIRFNVASNYRTRTPEGEWQDKTEWVRVTVTGQRAESLGQYLKKGSRVYVDGRLEARPWTDSRGEIKAGLEVMASQVEFMSSRDDNDREPSVPSAHTPRQPVSATPGNALEERNGGLEDLPF